MNFYSIIRRNVLPIIMTGGAESTSGGYVYHTFNEGGDLVVSGGSKSIEYIVVGALKFAFIF